MSEAGSDSSGISSHDGNKSGTDSDYYTEPSIISAISSSFMQEIVIVKIIIIIKWLGQFLNIHFCYVRERNVVE